jgi:cellulose biosynthesis protein BcsQ
MNTVQRAAIVAMISPKGGVGKSLTCLTLAASLTRQGYSVRIIDFDQTETLFRWFKENPSQGLIENLTVEKGPKESVDTFINALWDYKTSPSRPSDLTNPMPPKPKNSTSNSRTLLSKCARRWFTAFL